MAFKFLFIRIISTRLHGYPISMIEQMAVIRPAASLPVTRQLLLYRGNIYCVFTNHEITVFIVDARHHAGEWGESSWYR